MTFANEFVNDATLHLFHSYQAAATRQIERGERPALYACEVAIGEPCSHVFVRDVRTDGVMTAVGKLVSRCPYGPLHVISALTRSSITAIGGGFGGNVLREDDADTVESDGDSITIHTEGITINIPC